MLTSLVIDVVEGMHYTSKVRILERDPRRRHQGLLVLEQLHLHFPDWLPRRAFEQAYAWAEGIDHDGYNLDGSLIFKQFGADCALLDHIEAGCQGHSALGPRTGSIIRSLKDWCKFLPR